MSGDTGTAEAERPRLIAVAFRMLGELAEAEDAVQEAYVRWYGLDDAERAAIRVPGAWLTRVVSRIVLDVLGSARARRERYVGEWLPEPVPAEALRVAGIHGTPPGDPLDRVSQAESVSTALLLLLEALTPAERVVFVLHDVFGVPFDEVAAAVGRTPAACRQLASSARRHVREGRRVRADAARHDDLVQAFAAACLSGDLAAVVAVLDDTVTLRSDGGGVVSAARRPVTGATDVARFLLGLLAKWPDAEVEAVRTGDGLALVARQGGAVTTVVNVGAGPDAVTDVWVMRNPEKMRLWNR
ncbi:sigma-70 family RNA polymerase sigma factor [Microbacterium resistens]|uniref:RNA polymerase sigma factor SigJ n=1 Tax=Microbacterium resistens TaxID=156977 RepID=UPI001C561290|nr:RNA polymerase sigma factor SigJ [Microbacterium resistens]MBW1640103.1 sigma-70 family RNA polymerase sigma factor [Microbacterium resistens]